MSDEWKQLRTWLEKERRSYAETNGRSKDARIIFAALEGAYGGVLRKMDGLQKATDATSLERTA